MKQAIDREFAPAGYNVGFNAGETAGQTVMHLHVHVIPRYNGELDDPRGGAGSKIGLGPKPDFQLESKYD